MTIPYWTLWDMSAGAEASYSTADATWRLSNAGVAFNQKPFNPSLGQLNGLNGKPYLSSYGYIENHNIIRGPVRFAQRGLASLVAGVTVVDTSGKRWLSAGGAGIQGFRIE
jgi:hypothetical protein